MSKNAHIMIRMDSELLKVVKTAARLDRRSVSDFARLALEDRIRQIAPALAKKLEALSNPV